MSAFSSPSAEKRLTIHLIYIHGFQGDHTSFQAFPTDLHNNVLSKLPAYMALNSCLYPTYKSRKPIGYVAKNFLKWLETLEPGPVILLAHSMGGLLAVDAATDHSCKEPRRIKAIVAFDVPYLSMHPHVIISGIASLFPNNGGKQQTEKELNDEDHVNFVDRKVLGDDDSSVSSPGASSIEDTSYLRSSQSDISTSSTSLRTTRSTSSQSILTSSLTSSVELLDKASIFVSKHTDDPLVKFLRKHSNDPLSAMQRWVIEHFQFGQCMFDPVGLHDRYRALEAWDGLWVNFWTETVPKPGAISPEEEEAKAQNDDALPETTAEFGNVSLDENREGVEGPEGPRTKEEEKAHMKRVKSAEKERQKQLKRAEKEIKKQREKEKKTNEPRPARHFIVLPGKLNPIARDKWIKVPIAGAEDEVQAHCGLFIREQNLDYDAFVEKAGDVMIGWCRTFDIF